MQNMVRDGRRPPIKQQREWGVIIGLGVGIALMVGGLVLFNLSSRMP